MRKQRFIADRVGGRPRTTRAKQLHIRVTEDQIALFKLAASHRGESVAKWAIDLLTAASAPRDKGPRRAQRRATVHEAWGVDDE
jgi:hypothetical protein